MEKILDFNLAAISRLAIQIYKSNSREIEETFAASR